MATVLLLVRRLTVTPATVSLRGQRQSAPDVTQARPDDKFSIPPRLRYYHRVIREFRKARYEDEPAFVMNRVILIISKQTSEKLTYCLGTSGL
jgi:hypothetical protein